MARFLRRFLPCAAAVAAGAMVLSSSSPAHAGGSGDGIVALVYIVGFDIISLPGDIYYAAENKPVPNDWAMGEAIAGGLQMTAGAIGLGYCVTNLKCRSGAGLPALGVFTGWTTTMMIHGIYELSSGHDKGFARATKGPQLSIAPMIGDARTTPASVELVGSF